MDKQPLKPSDRVTDESGLVGTVKGRATLAPKQTPVLVVAWDKNGARSPWQHEANLTKVSTRKAG